MNYSTEELYKYIFIEKIPYNTIGKIYGVSGTTIRKTAVKLGFKLPTRRKINEKETFNKGKSLKKLSCLFCGSPIVNKHNTKFCSSKCCGEYQHQIAYNKLLSGDKSIMRANYNPIKFKDLIIKEQGNVCAICGMHPIWNNNPLVFILDHIDGHASNNRRDNLRCICPNCDSQLDTYKSKNKKSDRKQYSRFKN